MEVKFILTLGALLPELMIRVKLTKSSNFSITNSLDEASFLTSSGSRMISELIFCIRVFLHCGVDHYYWYKPKVR